jgi:dihydroorotase
MKREAMPHSALAPPGVAARIASRAGWTPHHGREVTGWPVGTFVRGAKVMWQGEITTPSRGDAVRFHAAL